MDNPFKVLGIAPEGLRGLSEADILELAKANFRFRSKIYHPQGSRPNLVRFNAINYAMEQLEETGAIPTWKQHLLRPKKEQIAEINARAQSVAQETDHIKDLLLEFWTAYALGERFPGTKPKANGDIEAFSCFRFQLCSFAVSDSLRNTVLERTRRGRKEVEEQVVIHIDGKRILTRWVLHKKAFDPSTEEAPSWIAPQLIQTNPTHPAKSYYWSGADERSRSTLLPMRLLGGIPKFELSQRDGIDRFQPLLTAETTPSQLEEIEGGYSWEVFQPFAALMSPIIRVDSEIIAVSGASENELRFHFLGKPRKMFRFRNP